jgi:class 3 adenylate cyclase
MVQNQEQRRLAAILAADMVGFSRLMERDEDGIVSRQRAHRAELIDPQIDLHHGRIVKTTGDGMLAEFVSVLDAVRCAIAIQESMIVRESGSSEDLRIQYRIGINLGDVVVDGEDIFGEGVNVAARLETLSEPGGMCVSDAVHRSVENKVTAVFRW